jgi:hypothetical protein
MSANANTGAGKTDQTWLLAAQAVAAMAEGERRVRLRGLLAELVAIRAERDEAAWLAAWFLSPPARARLTELVSEERDVLDRFAKALAEDMAETEGVTR